MGNDQKSLNGRGQQYVSLGAVVAVPGWVKVREHCAKISQVNTITGIVCHLGLSVDIV